MVLGRVTGALGRVMCSDVKDFGCGVEVAAVCLDGWLLGCVFCVPVYSVCLGAWCFRAAYWGARRARVRDGPGG